MANPELAIAKATFSVSLFRKDPVVAAPCTRDEADQFHRLLQDAVRQCSPLNVQNCKRWILKHVVSSPSRAVALAKYLVAVANSFTEDGWQEGGEAAERDTTRRKSSGKPTARRKRLHVAYVLHDVLYHAKKHGGESRWDGFAGAVRDSLVPLFSSVAAFDAPRHVGKVNGLLDIWDKEGLCVPNQISSLRAAVEAASTGGANYLGTSTALIAGSSSPARTKEVPFMIPAMHGDPSTPWFDLPAANWLSHMRPNSTKPINPNLIKPLQFSPGLADMGLVDAVKRLLSNVDRIFARDGGMDGDEPYADVNEMGERVILDELTGDITGGQTYYGWSRDFCKKMSRRQKGGDAYNERRGRSMSRSSGRSSGRSDSRESSSPAHKRRRLSRSRSRGRRYSSGSRRSASRRSRSKSRSLSRLRDRSRSRNRSYSRDRYRRRSSSPRRASRSRSRSKSRDRDYRRRYSPSPPPPDRDGTGYAEHPQQPHFQQHIPPPHLPHQPFYPSQGSPPPSMPVPPPNFMAFPQDPVIPPPPPNYSGPWPPPPPPIPPPIGNPHVQNMGMPWGPAPVLPGGHAPPPPPPPPPNPTPSHPQQFGRSWARPPNSQYGRGNNSFRGGYGGRGRGRSWQ